MEADPEMVSGFRFDWPFGAFDSWHRGPYFPLRGSPEFRRAAKQVREELRWHPDYVNHEFKHPLVQWIAYS
ncbi:hypothetical protein QKT49_gp160 [Acanthamoeba castellanii medusavirus]|uniref:Uncharacterized protein n=1 Tax=Acanthamoeba castellanii medusavirus J1 TaxID=3114988 RepID=A0A3T1CWT7_9VIRU|nr:hypothetical protein QKT49_gp160 [Acanthamoeba castellanii medusavirus]BBI30300.1 hypothetical protein [Acanthamoeba castellanii medusavirus J1]